MPVASVGREAEVSQWSRLSLMWGKIPTRSDQLQHNLLKL